MAIFDWISQKASQSEKVSGSRHYSPEAPEAPVASVTEAPLSNTLSNELVSPTGTEQSIALEKIPQEFGCLRSWRGSLILLVTSGSQFLDNVFMTSSNMALASIQEEFKVSNTDLQWMISAYTLSFGGLLLLAGSLSDR